MVIDWRLHEVETAARGRGHVVVVTNTHADRDRDPGSWIADSSAQVGLCNILPVTLFTHHDGATQEEADAQWLPQKGVFIV